MSQFPTSFADVGAWSEDNSVGVEAGRRRFIQFVILAVVANSQVLREGLVFKGGNALDFIWQPNRSTLDLDFSIDHDLATFSISEESIRRHMERSMLQVQQQYGVRLAVHYVRQVPPGDHRTFRMYVVRVGYAFPDQDALRRRMETGRPSPHVVDVEISVNEPIGSSTWTHLVESLPHLRVGTIEDIIAEKLRSLLQQLIRNRQRRQDLLDIAVLLILHSDLDRQEIGRILTLKSNARGIDARRSAFANPEIRNRASVDYNRLQQTTRVLFVPVDDAWDLLMELVQTLPIPD